MKKEKRKKFKVRLFFPDKKSQEEMAEFIVIPAVDGDLGILAGHTPLISAMRPGEIVIKTDIENKNQREILVKSGFVEVGDNQVTLLIKN